MDIDDLLRSSWTTATTRDRGRLTAEGLKEGEILLPITDDQVLTRLLSKHGITALTP